MEAVVENTHPLGALECVVEGEEAAAAAADPRPPV
jgi:hypothetical protein